jgi:hypothetical protein
MAVTTFDPYDEGISTEEQARQAAALAQGEALAVAQEADQRQRLDELSRETEPVELIAGKFKSQDDLLKAYKELEAKLGSKAPEEGEEPSEELTEQAEEDSEEDSEEETPSFEPFAKATAEFDQTGIVSDEMVAELAKLDSKDLINQYIEYYKATVEQVQQKELEATAVAQIQGSVGGPDAYTEMIGWAAENLDAEEIDAFNTITNSGDVGAVKFAVQALHSRYKNVEGYEAPLVSGKGAKVSGPKPYRSNAELARDIADPRYDRDPAFRSDVMDRLARSGDLL